MPPTVFGGATAALVLVAAACAAPSDGAPAASGGAAQPVTIAAATETAMQTRQWTAWANLQPGFDRRAKLHVRGQVRAPAGAAIEVSLRPRDRGGDPLIVDLVVSGARDGGPGADWVEARLAMDLRGDYPRTVHVRHDGAVVAELDVRPVF